MHLNTELFMLRKIEKTRVNQKLEEITSRRAQWLDWQSIDLFSRQSMDYFS